MTKPVRAAWITTGFAAAEGDHTGMASIHDLARYLSMDAGLDLSIFALYYPSGTKPVKFCNSWVFPAKTKGEVFSSISKLQKLRSFRRIISLFEKEHNKKPFDLVHSIWAGEAGYASAHIAKKYDLPLVVNICGGELAELPEIRYGSRTKPFQKYFVDRAFEKADIIICACDFITEKIKKYYSKTIHDKVRVLPFGADGNMFFESPGSRIKNAGKPVLINIAGALPVKAHKDLFTALNIVKEKYPAVLLECFGHDDKNILKELVKSMGLNENVNINGFVEHGKLPSILSKGDAYVLSSLYESQNISLLEAAFTGLPVVSTDVGIAKDITPLISKPGDAAALAANIIKALEYPNMNYPGIKEKFSLKSCSEGFIKLYRELTTP